MQFLHTLWSVLFPDTCVGCRSRDALLCGACLQKLVPASSSEEPYMMSAYSYKDSRVRQLIRILKYKKMRHAADVFAPALAGLLTEFLGEERLFIGGRVLLVPVPISRSRYRERGYNQAESLARATFSRLPKETARFCSVDTTLLEKYIDTTPQAKIKTRAERLAHLGDCFRVRPGCIPAGETIVLIDDVITTGATIRVARQALLRAGFRSVYALSVAH